jgi:hypothetical protein
VHAPRNRGPDARIAQERLDAAGRARAAGAVLVPRQ